jgi:hypothetical protein
MVKKVENSEYIHSKIWTIFKSQKKVISQYEKGLNVVLSTSHNDFVTSRTVTLITFKDALYLTSIKRPRAIKIEQIEKKSQCSYLL